MLWVKVNAFDHYFWVSLDYSVAISLYSSDFSYFLEMNVGIRAKIPKKKRVKKLVGLKPILSIAERVNPVCIKMKLLGIRPKIR